MCFCTLVADKTLKDKQMKKGIILLAILMITFNIKAQEMYVFNANERPQLTQAGAEHLASLAFHCIQTEYPNKLGHVILDASQVRGPLDLHPAFYGCFDWHSSVHGHWTLLNVLREIPNFEHKEAIWKKLNANLTKENILKEVAYFDDVHNKTFERTYGWAWLLKVSETLQDWNSPEAAELNDNLKPLVDLIERGLPILYTSALPIY